MANRTHGGFRYRGNRENPNSLVPRFEIYPVATAYATVLYYGDPVKQAADGSIQAAVPGDILLGVFQGSEQYFDGTVMTKGPTLPVSTYGTNMSRQSKARVVLAKGGIWEVDADDGVTATTQAAWEALIGENAEWVTGTPNGQYSGAALDISGHATTATFTCRIVDIPNRDQQDLASSRVKVYIQFNLTADPISGRALGT